MTNYKCTFCNCDFDLAGGGIAGDLGMIPAAFCPTCRAGLWDMHEQLRLPVMCPECGWSEDDDQQSEQG